MKIVDPGAEIQVSFLLIGFFAFRIIRTEGPIINPETKSITVIRLIPEKNTHAGMGKRKVTAWIQIAEVIRSSAEKSQLPLLIIPLLTLSADKDS